MKVLVTGGAGFIGGHTAERLLARGDTVIVVDSMNPYYDVSIKEFCLEILRERAASSPTGSTALTICRADVRNKEELREIFSSHRPDVVCHLAAQAGVRFSIDNVDDNIASNISGTVNILDLCREFQPRNVVVASSSSVYGESSTPPFDEDQACSKPISPYAAAKRSVELFAHTFHHLYKLNVTLLRFFTVYGPRCRPDMAVLKILNSMDKGVHIDKYGDGSAVRDFTYIDDIVDGVLASIDKVRPYVIVNLGGGSMHTLDELIETIERHMGQKALVNVLPTQPGDVSITSACQKRAREVLNFEPKVGLDEGIRRTVAWFKKRKTEPAEAK